MITFTLKFASLFHSQIKMSLNLRNDLGSSDIWQCRITEVPQSLYSHICDSLNLHNVLGKDWKGLAGSNITVSHKGSENNDIR